jgi:hypothetical protein
MRSAQNEVGELGKLPVRVGGAEVLLDVEQVAGYSRITGEHFDAGQSGLVRQGGGEAGGERRDRGPEFLAASDVEGERDSGQPLLGVHCRVAGAADEHAPA